MSFPNTEFFIHHLETTIEYLEIGLPGLQRIIPRELLPHEVKQIVRLTSGSKIVDVIEFLERESHQQLRWTDLKGWLSDMRKHIETQIQLLRSFSRLLGQDLPSDLEEGNQGMRDWMQQRIEFMQLQYGSQCLSFLDQFSNIAGLHVWESHDVIPLSKVQSHIEEKTKRILQLWNDMGKMQPKGLDKLFATWWDKLTFAQRSEWLGCHFPELPRQPNPEIRQLLLKAKANEKPRLQAFLTPLLNISDLCQADTLPQLLQVRASRHPRLFLALDSRSVVLGHWLGAFKNLKIGGRMLFPVSGSFDQHEYGILWEHHTANRPTWLNPSLGMNQVNAQEATYNFLHKCLKIFINEPSIVSQTPINETMGAGGDSMLNQYLPLTFFDPKHIEWQRLQDLIRTSRDDAIGDLEQLRTSDTCWLMCIRKTVTTGGRTCNLLRSVFDCVDIFDSLYIEIQNVTQPMETQTLELSQDIGHCAGLVSIDAMLCCAVNDILCALRLVSWLPKETSQITPLDLIRMMRDDDPTLRIAGFDAVLRAVDQELQDVKVESGVPSRYLKVLNDLSVLTICRRETSKHYCFIDAMSDEYLQEYLAASRSWQDRHRPWSTVLNTIVDSRDFPIKKLDATVLDNSALNERHVAFWNAFDRVLTSSGIQSSIATIILATTPANDRQIGTEPRFMGFLLNEPTTMSNTKIKRSKGRASVAEMPSAPMVSTPRSSPSRAVLHVTSSKQQEFWKRIWHDGTGHVTFQDFADFMGHLGFKRQNQGGSGRRFKFI